MKKIAILAISILLIGLTAATQAFAGFPPIGVKGTEKPKGTEAPPNGPGGAGSHTPGAKATEHAGFRGKPQMYRGTIAAVDVSSLTLTLPDGSSAVVGLVPQTKIKVPGPKSAGDTLSVGMQAMAMAYDQAGTLVARMVIAIPGQPVRAHRVGTVTAYTAGSSITIQATDGSTYTFGMTADTRILPEARAGDLAVGSLVTVIAPRVPSSVDWTAKGIVVHPSS